MSGGADVMPMRTSSPPFSVAPTTDIRSPGTIDGTLNSSRGLNAAAVPRSVGASGGGGGEAGERAQYMLKQILKQQQQQYEQDTDGDIGAVGAAERWLSERERRQRERTEKLRESLKRKSQTSTQLNNTTPTNNPGSTPNSQQVIQQLLLGEKTALNIGGGSLPHQHYSHLTNSTSTSYHPFAAIENGATNQTNVTTNNHRPNLPQPVSASSTTFPEIVAVERGRTEFFLQQNANMRNSGPGCQDPRTEGKLMTSNNSLMSSRSQQPQQRKPSGTQSPTPALQLPPLNGTCNSGAIQSYANNNNVKANNGSRKISNKTTTGSTAKISSNGCEVQTLNSNVVTSLTDKNSGIAVPSKRWSVAASAADTNLLLFNQAVHRQQKQSSATAPGGVPRLNGHNSFELVPVGIPISALHYTAPENNTGSAPDINNNNVSNNNNGSGATSNSGVTSELKVFPEGVGGVSTKKYAINFCHLADAPLNFANHYLQERSKEQLDYRSICGFWLNHLSHYSPDSWMPLHQNSLILLSSGNNNPNNPQYNNNNNVTNGGFQGGEGDGLGDSDDEDTDERVLRRPQPAVIQQQGQKGTQRQQVANQKKVKGGQNTRQQQLSSTSSTSEFQQQTTKRL